MTSLAGSSDVFWGGVVTYADGAKSALLGVPPEMIENYGAVSGEVARAMVEGLVRISGVPLGVSITGVAGPGGGSLEKPVGTVWFGLWARTSGRAQGVAARAQFVGSRHEVQAQASHKARALARIWWESDMDLDSLLSLTDNVGKPFVKALSTPFLFLPHSP